MAIIMGVVVMILGTIAIRSVDILFELSCIDDTAYLYWLAFS